MRVMTAVLVAACFVGACAGPEPEIEAEAPETIEVTSVAFEDGATIPVRFTCDGEDVSPPLSWSNVPADTKEIVILVEDPDAPRGTFVHWIVAGLDAATGGLDAGGVPAGAVEGTNGFDEVGYGGPCPPEGDDPHRYEFVVHAVDRPTGLGDGVSAAEVRETIGERTIATGTLTAEYGRG